MISWDAQFDNIDWSKLTTAYGTAIEIPRFLKALKSRDSEAANSALDVLVNHLHCDGDVFDSTLASVPILTAALIDTDVLCRAKIAILIGSVARSLCTLEFEQTFRSTFMPALKHSFNQMRALALEEPNVRMSVAFALSWLLSCEREFVSNVGLEFSELKRDLLEQVSQEKLTEVESSLVCSLALLGCRFRDQELIDEIASLELSTPAAVAAATQLGLEGFAASEAIDLIKDYLYQPGERFWQSYRQEKNCKSILGFPWFDGDVEKSIFEVVTSEPYCHSESAILIAGRILSEFNRENVSYLYEPLCTYFDGFDFLESERDRKAIKESWVRVLCYVHDNDALWSDSSQYSGVVQHVLNVPDSTAGRSRLQAYLGCQMKILEPQQQRD